MLNGVCCEVCASYCSLCHLWYRDTQKYGVPRPTLQGDEQKIQFNQMVNGRNLQQPGGSVPGAFPAGVDRGARIMPAAHGMGTVAGLNRGMPAGRPGFPRINSPAMLNAVSSGNMLTNSGQGVPNAASVHPGAISGPGNSILRPHNSMQTLRVSSYFMFHMLIGCIKCMCMKLACLHRV